MGKNIVRATPPTKDPDQVYPKVPGIDFKDFELSSEGLPQAQINKALAELLNYETLQKANFLGYQANQKLDFDSDLHQYLNYHINNIGDPFQSGNFTVNSKFVERAVLDYFASLWNARWPHENDPQLPYEEWKDSYWGYVLSMGSSEGNVYGLWNARDYLAGKFLLEDPEVEHVAREASKNGRTASVQRRLIYYQANADEDNLNEYSPVAFYSQDTHYSIIKFMSVLNFPTFYEIAVDKKFPSPLKFPDDYPPQFSSQYIDQRTGWPFEVPSNEDGSVYIPALVKLVDFFAYRGYPALVSFNYGTTFKGAFDNVKSAVDNLVPIFQKYNLYKRKVYYDPKDKTKFDIRNGFWFHVDGALGAAYMPYMEMALNEGRLDAPKDYEFPVFDFRIEEIHSIVMSGHKWIGAPWPCGVFMTKVKFQLQPPDNPEYIGSLDTTFAGSRNGFSALILWDYLAKHSYDSLVQKALNLEVLASYAENQLRILSQQIGIDLWVDRSPLSLTIRFREANPTIVYTYSLSGEVLYVNGERRQYSHIFIMEHVTKDLINKLIKDLSQSGAFPPQEVENEIPENLIVPNAKKLLHVPHTGRGFK